MQLWWVSCCDHKPQFKTPTKPFVSISYFSNFLGFVLDEEVLSVKEESETSERGGDGEQDPTVWKWC